MIDLAAAPAPLTPAQRRWLFLITAVVALSRVAFPARSPWDWDEILFSLAVKQYDVALHHPHPPGFPLFIGLAKLLAAAGLPVFRALQSIDIVSGCLIVPAMFAFCRELRFRYSTSIIAASFLAFFPNVWFFGETGFSDVPAIVLAVAACAFLLRGCRSNRGYVTGALLLAAAAAFRPQNLLVGLAPAIIATWFRWRAREWRVVIAGAAGAVALVGVSYGAAIAATGGWQTYDEAVRTHQQYITTVDSFRSPIRPSLPRVFDDFFIRPYRAPLVNTLVTVLAAISLIDALVRRRGPVLLAVATFGPLAIAAWMLLDFLSASRFSIGYAPLMAVLAADGVTLLAAVVRSPGKAAALEAGIAVASCGLMIAWTLPALLLTRRESSPPVQAVDWIRAHVPRGSVIRVHRISMRPYAEWFLPDYRCEWVREGPLIASLDGSPSWYLREGRSALSGALNFSWPHGRAWNVARRRYFDVTVVGSTATPRFAGGWYDEERNGAGAWRWLAGRGTIDLPPVSGSARLKLRIFVPLHVLSGTPLITIRMNGAAVQRFRPRQTTTDTSLDFAMRGSPAVLEIETDQTVNLQRANLGTDPRELGLRLDRLEWIAMGE